MFFEDSGSLPGLLFGLIMPAAQIVRDGQAQRQHCRPVARTTRAQEIHHPGVAVLFLQKLCQLYCRRNGIGLIVWFVSRRPKSQGDVLILFCTVIFLRVFQKKCGCSVFGWLWRRDFFFIASNLCCAIARQALV